MAKKGQSIKNRTSGETITWFATAHDTQGKYLELGMEVEPRGLASVKHIHRIQDEFFEVKRGTLKIQVNNTIHYLKAGQSMLVPKGAPHQWWNPSETEDIQFNITFTPAHNTEKFFEFYFGLQNDGKNNPDGSVTFWQTMAAINEYEIYLSGIPIVVQRLIGLVLAPIANLLGYRKTYPKYHQPETDMRPVDSRELLKKSA
jgi:mannose-6-phosphate isomerase-like protein (cupin superfamily)